MNVQYANFLQRDIAAFDAPFFSIQPSEAASLDPQQRCLLEISYHAFENGMSENRDLTFPIILAPLIRLAGIPLSSIVTSKTSVFVGNSVHDYESILLKDPGTPAKYIGTGIGSSMLANRISWFYDLQGPSISLDTACSSSLSALHLACQSLRNRESHMVSRKSNNINNCLTDKVKTLFGRCNLVLAPDVSQIPLADMGFLSPDGKCFSIDHRSNGCAKGEGAGFFVIKLLSDAISDGDTIRAVIRSTGINQDGKTPCLKQPSKEAQEKNIRDTYRNTNLDLDTTEYFESHGTGTQLVIPSKLERSMLRSRDCQ